MKLNALKMVVVIMLLSFTSCKKAIEAAKEQAVVDAITDGVWYVSKFTQAGTDVTASFSGWEFIYYSNGTSVASKTGNASVNGTWAGNASNFTFTAGFVGTPPSPLEKLAGVWTVVRAVSTTKGSYSKTESGIVYELDLTKK